MPVRQSSGKRKLQNPKARRKAPRRKPGEVAKKAVEQIVKTYESTMGTRPHVEIEVDEERGFWKITIMLSKKAIGKYESGET